MTNAVTESEVHLLNIKDLAIDLGHVFLDGRFLLPSFKQIRQLYCIGHLRHKQALRSNKTCCRQEIGSPRNFANAEPYRPTWQNQAICKGKCPFSTNYIYIAHANTAFYLTLLNRNPFL